jgi:hypothetical protein
MNAAEQRVVVENVKVNVQTTRINLVSNLHVITEALATLTRLESASPDAVIAIQGLAKVEQDLLEVTDELLSVTNDIENYRWRL